jgi:ABC-type lipoprotein release transport system permease subunit
LGFTSRQLVATVAWQASVAGTVGVIAGVPLGIIIGRWLWILFARSVYVVPDPTVPVLSVVVVSFSALVVSNVVAAFPGRSAARTSTARVLRGE